MLRAFLISVFLIAPGFGVAEDWKARADAAANHSFYLQDFLLAQGEMGQFIPSDYRPNGEIACAVAGEMLGLGAATAHIMPQEPSRDGALDMDALYEIKQYAIMLEIWADRMREMADQSADQIAAQWNLDCPGRFEIASNTYVEAAQTDAWFRQDGGSLTVLGDFEKGFFKRFETWLSEHPDTRLVFLESGGGYVVDAMKTGRLIRERGIETQVGARNCESACALAFMGGTTRTIMAPWKKLGFHRLSVNGEDIPTTNPVYDAIRDYAAAMNADPSQVIRAMDQAAPDTMFEPEWEYLCKANIATFVQRSCSASDYR